MKKQGPPPWGMNQVGILALALADDWVMFLLSLDGIDFGMRDTGLRRKARACTDRAAQGPLHIGQHVAGQQFNDLRHLGKRQAADVDLRQDALCRTLGRRQ